MIRRNQIFSRGQILVETVIDPDAGTFTRIERGEVVEERAATAEEIASAKPRPKYVEKLTILDRMDRQEIAKLRATFNQMRNDTDDEWKLTELWHSSGSFDTTHPKFAHLQAAFVDMYGETRTAELLAPSE